MNLLGAIVEQQNSLFQFYRKLEERFEENSIVQALWRDMAGDVSMQIQSLKTLPPSFWNQFKQAPDDGFESAIKSVPSPPANVTDISLRDSFEISLQLSEHVVLKIYARAVRLLRRNSTTPALNFYILVKTYVARLLRTTESFAGDPLLIRRAHLLLAGLEKEVQEPVAEIKPLMSKSSASKAQKTPSAVGKDVKKTRETTKPPPKNAKAAVSKPEKAASVKAPPGKKPATSKRT